MREPDPRDCCDTTTDCHHLDDCSERPATEFLGKFGRGVSVPESDQPDWNRLGRETRWSRDDRVAAAMYLADLDWRGLWPSVEAFVNQGGFSPISAARMVRMSLSTPSAPTLPEYDQHDHPQDCGGECG